MFDSSVLVEANSALGKAHKEANLVCVKIRIRKPDHFSKLDMGKPIDVTQQDIDRFFTLCYSHCIRLYIRHNHLIIRRLKTLNTGSHLLILL